jgi:hypothetical protein
MARALLSSCMLNLYEINRALDRLGEAAFVPRTRRLRVAWVAPTERSRGLPADQGVRRRQSPYVRRTMP